MCQWFNLMSNYCRNKSVVVYLFSLNTLVSPQSYHLITLFSFISFMVYFCNILREFKIKFHYSLGASVRNANYISFPFTLRLSVRSSVSPNETNQLQNYEFSYWEFLLNPLKVNLFWLKLDKK
jgi:hypothetical protein